MPSVHRFRTVRVQGVREFLEQSSHGSDVIQLLSGVEHLKGAYDHGQEAEVEEEEGEDPEEEVNGDYAVDEEDEQHVNLLSGNHGLENGHSLLGSVLHHVICYVGDRLPRVVEKLQHKKTFQVLGQSEVQTWNTTANPFCYSLVMNSPQLFLNIY